MRTFLIYFPFFVWAIALVVFVRPLSSVRRVRIAWSLVLLLCAAKFVFFERFGGDAFNPEFPDKVIWVANVFYSGMMLLTAFAVVSRLVRLRGRILLVLPVVSWGLAIRGVFNGLTVPSVREVELAFANLPAELDGYRLVQITDLHVSAAARRWRTQAIVDKVNALRVDLIVCTGDIVDGKPEDRKRDVEPLKDLSAPDGVYYVTGNHEYYGDVEEWQALYRDWNFRFLENECVFPRPALALAGIPDATGGKRGLASTPDVTAAFAAETNGAFRVLLAHRPGDPLPRIYDLQLSGHTHGGIMPVLSSLVKVYNHGFVRGLYNLGGKARLYLSSGAGQWAGFPIRFLDDSEITLITLRSRSREALM